MENEIKSGHKIPDKPVLVANEELKEDPEPRSSKTPNIEFLVGQRKEQEIDIIAIREILNYNREISEEEEMKIIEERAAIKERGALRREEYKKNADPILPVGVYIGKKYPNFIVRWSINVTRLFLRMWIKIKN